MRHLRQMLWLVPVGIMLSSVISWAEEHLHSAEIIRDQWGVPHIFSETDAGAMYGLGYAAAEDRLIQMEISRRIMQGRLSELLGEVQKSRRDESSVTSDRSMRIVGYYRHAQRVFPQLDNETQCLLQAYADGVNRYIKEHPDHFERIVPAMVFTPEPWTPEDCIASWYHIAQFFSGDGLNEAHQVDRPDRMGPNPIDDEAAVVKREDVEETWIARVHEFASAHGYGETGQGGESDTPQFSHAWVVGGERTSTGAAVLASDPQTQVRLPSLFYEFHVSGATLNARGIGVAGSPVILIGWNQHVAWGMTALGADQADLFRLTLDKDHPNQYQWEGQWKEMTVLDEPIHIKDGETIPLTVRETHLGPVVTEILKGNIEPGEYALCRVPQALLDRDTMQAGVEMMRAADVHEFGAALERWSFPSANVVFGDDRGDIGYWMTVAMPVRSAHARHGGRNAMDAERELDVWQGFVPHELLPHVFNPKPGWIASANHRPVEAWYPQQQPGGTGSNGHTSRSWRLYELLEAHEGKITPEDVLAMHFDDIEPTRRTLVEAAEYAVYLQNEEFSEEAMNALQPASGWLSRGAHCDLNDAGYPVVFFMNTMFRLAGTPLGRYGGGQSGLVAFCRSLQYRIHGGGSMFIDPDECAYLDNALAHGWNTCVERFGNDPERWPERLRESVRSRKLDYMVSLDGFPALGRNMELAYPELKTVDHGTIFSQEGQSYSQFVSLIDVDSAFSLLPIGNTENPNSPYYTVTFDAWAKGEHHPAPLSREAVEKYAVERKVLN